MFDKFELSDIKLIILVGFSLVVVLIVWSIISSFVTVVSGLVVESDKKLYNEIMETFKERFVDILDNENYTEVKRTYLMSNLSQELEKINFKYSKKYLGAVIRENVKLHNIETFPGDIPNNVYLKMPTSDESFIWVVFSDTKSRYINFDKGEEVEVDGVIDRVNLVSSNLPESVNQNLDKFFKADFALHLQDDAKIKKLKS